VTDDQIAARLAVLGAGAMWVSIATRALGHGLPVLVVDAEATAVVEVITEVTELKGAGRVGQCSQHHPRGVLCVSANRGIDVVW
jgi:methoxymalonate biosynthesis protein